MPLSTETREYLKTTKDERIDLSNHGLNDDDMVDLVELLRGKKITSLNLYRNNIGGGAAALSELNIGYINLRSNDHIRDALPVLLANSNIQYLGLADNHLTDEDGKLIARETQQQNLSFSKNSEISTVTADAIYKRLAANRTKAYEAALHKVKATGFVATPLGRQALKTPPQEMKQRIPEELGTGEKLKEQHIPDKIKEGEEVKEPSPTIVGQFTRGKV